MSTIRPALPADAAAVVAVRATVFPYLVRGVAATSRMIASPPPGEDWAAFVATDAGQVVGWVAAFRDVRAAAADAGRISLLHVDPAYRRRGIGDALHAAATDHLRAVGVRPISTIVQSGSLAFARRHGFEPTREIRYSALDLSRLPAAPPAGGRRAESAGDVRVVPFGELDEPALYAADVAAATDEPGDLPLVASPYSTWRYEVWDNPDLDRRASTVAVRDGHVLAFTLLHRDGVRVWSDMTATVPEHRGRGLARLVKWTALARAATGGATVAYTANDESNRPMLAVNEQLGYRPVATQFSCVTTIEG
jgi:GNAT superfamily N-acetyltransferase